MKRAIIAAVLAALMGASVHAQEGSAGDVPTFRWCMDEVMGSLRSIVAPAEETAAITMNMPAEPAPEPEPDAAVPPPPPPPPMPVRPLPLNDHLAQQCPVMRIEAGDAALAQYCDPAVPSDKWSCAVGADGSAIVTFAPQS